MQVLGLLSLFPLFSVFQMTILQSVHGGFCSSSLYQFLIFFLIWFHFSSHNSYHIPPLLVSPVIQSVSASFPPTFQLFSILYLYQMSSYIILQEYHQDIYIPSDIYIPCDIYSSRWYRAMAQVQYRSAAIHAVKLLTQFSLVPTNFLPDHT